MYSKHRNATGGFVGNGPSLEPPNEPYSYDDRVADAIAAMSYADLREKVSDYQSENRLRGWKRRERFSAWLREDVENRLIAADHKANEDWY